MKAKAIRELPMDELAAKERSLVEDLFQARFRKYTGQLENTSRFKELKRDLARVKTISREKREKKNG
ncbi:MAG: 50S ribosomal protein L29 [Deltaproteobacteria bacterium]|nr:50S ribosomal protein L29 [Deltaproteobacteria bacterium]